MRCRFTTVVPSLLALSFVSGLALAQTPKKGKPAAAPAPAAAAPQKIDEEYTKLIKEYLQDPRISTELVDHMPASDTVPSPLKFFGRIPGTPGELTYAHDINRYFDALGKASKRAKFWSIGTTEEGKEEVVLAIADEATIASLDKYKGMLAQLGDPRKTTPEQAQELIHTAKPIYYAASGIHSPETGGPEMLIELAYRLIVEETPFIQTIRNNAIIMITPVIEVDGREKVVDAYYASKKTGVPRNALMMYWGKYVQHDNNRDGMGQILKCTQNFTKAVLEWHPTILHDLHEAQSYLYVSAGTGPYNTSLDPIAIDEWWLLGETEIMEMTKRGVPGVWTYGYYDGWTPNYLFWIALTHNSFGRFYEVQSYGPDLSTANLGTNATSREWYRPNPPLPSIKWGPRNNTNIQESALLFAMNQVAKNKELYLENYYMKNKRSIEKGKNGPTYAWLIPAGQRRKADAADMVNDLRTQGVEIHRADAAFKVGNLDVAAGDFIIRGDQPYRTLADMYLSVQNFPVGNPNPYDDTGWTMQYMRDVKLETVTDASILQKPMTILTAEARAAGGVEGTGSVLLIDHTGDNNLTAFRFRNQDLKMMAAEDDFEVAGHKFRAGAFIVPNADRARIEPQLKELGLSAWAVSAAPPGVKTHALTTPRIGYVHSWSSTQNEGWTRAALDYYKIPYTYFADKNLREGNLRQKYDVIIFPHVGGTAQSMLNGVGGNTPIPYKKSELTPNLGALDSSDDIRGGMGFEGLLELSKFVQEGGTLLTEGSSATMMAEYDLGAGVTVEHPTDLFAHGTILRGVFADLKSPIAYGYDGKDLPVYFNQDPVFGVGGGGGGGGRGGRGGSGRVIGDGEVIGQNITPNATPIHVSPLEPPDPNAPVTVAPAAAAGRGGRGGGGRGGGRGGAPAAGAAGAPGAPAAVAGAAPAGRGGGGGRGGRGGGANEDAARVILRFPANTNDMLLSGTLAGGDALQNRALCIDAPLGKGHIVMFALRPFWRWQSQGTYTLAFNAIVNWDHLDAGKAAPAAAGAAAPGGGQ